MIKFYTNIENIEKNAQAVIEKYVSKDNISQICVFPDIHFCDEKSLPIGIAFSTTDVFYPLVTGKDVGCGVAFLRIKKSDWLKPFDKLTHYNSLNKYSATFTDEGLGGGNHFLSIEEGDDNYIYIICHTGTRNNGIYMYQQFLKMINDFNFKEGIDDFSSKRNDYGRISNQI